MHFKDVQLANLPAYCLQATQLLAAGLLFDLAQVSAASCADVSEWTFQWCPLSRGVSPLLVSFDLRAYTTKCMDSA